MVIVIIAIIIVIVLVSLAIACGLCICMLHEALFTPGIKLSCIQDLRAKTEFLFIQVATRNIKSKYVCKNGGENIS